MTLVSSTSYFHSIASSRSSSLALYHLFSPSLLPFSAPFHPGYVAAQALNDPDRFAGRHIKLAGDSLTVSELRQAYARVEKTSVWFNKVWMPSGVISLLPHDFKMMMRMFGKTGYTADVEALRREFPKLHTFEQWVRSVQASS